jgi:SulP family sulfate permease
MELAGSLGDLGTLLPIAIAMVLFNGLNPLRLTIVSERVPQGLM